MKEIAYNDIFACRFFHDFEFYSAFKLEEKKPFFIISFDSINEQTDKYIHSP